MLEQIIDIIRINIFTQLRTDNSFINLFFSSLLLTVVGFLIKKINKLNVNKINIINSKDWIKSFFYKKNIVVFEGKRTSISHHYIGTIVTSTFTDRFKAVWNEIITNIEKNVSINEITEMTGELDKDDKENDMNLFIVSQKKSFIYNKELDIRAFATILNDDALRGNNNEDQKSVSYANKTDIIIIELYSYKTSLNNIMKHVDEITEKYINSIMVTRKNKNFIYTIARTKYEENTYECWNEHAFESTRRFDNIFFSGKDEIINKLDFFLNNKEWYYDMGIPYSLGIGLYGPPGTGKTSLIKCIANMTKRHIVVISLKMLKTRNKLNEFFFENRYNKHNKKYSIDFNNKIIVFEDIDCIGEIVRKRQKKQDLLLAETNNNNSSNSNSNSNGNDNCNNNIKNILNDPLLEFKKDTKKMLSTVNDDELVTLDDILNLWDGIQETPGRIMIISSNHYDDLDPALIRPGRIDITLEMKNATHEVIKQMYEKYYKRFINKEQLGKIKSEFYSPAEIINLYILYKNEPKRFMERMMENKKIS